MSKFIFVTGGVVSGLGKGITAASLGRLLKQRGYKVTIQKFDPYINVDPGTMSPFHDDSRYRLRRLLFDVGSFVHHLIGNRRKHLPRVN